jgi:dTMP kinase
MAKGLFIVFEGIDGAGKTTHASRVAETLIAAGRRVHTTYEPTKGPAGVILRQHLEGRLNLDKRSLPYIFAADRSDHVFNQQNGIERSLNSGFDVICDRYILSSFAYQVPDSPFELVEDLNKHFPLPDVTFFLRTDPAKGIALKRRQNVYSDVNDDIDRQAVAAQQFEFALERMGTKFRAMVIDNKVLGLEETARLIRNKVLDMIGATVPRERVLTAFLEMLRREPKTSLGLNIDETFRLLRELATNPSLVAGSTPENILQLLVSTYFDQLQHTLASDSAFRDRFLLKAAESGWRPQ